jgi:hypothetical protein
MMKYLVAIMVAMITTVGITAGLDEIAGKHRVSFTDKIDVIESESFARTVEALDSSIEYQSMLIFKTPEEVYGTILIIDGQKDTYWNINKDKNLVADGVHDGFTKGGFFNTTLTEYAESATRKIDGKTGYISRIEATENSTGSIVDMFIMSYKESETTQVSIVMAADIDDRQIVFDILNSLKIS